jgi:hypothetical protein
VLNLACEPTFQNIPNNSTCKKLGNLYLLL